MSRFSGKQVTAMVLGGCAAIVLAPTAVFAAVEYSNVQIFDPISSRGAAVTNNRALVVGDGSGALTVDGTTSARPLSPTKTWRVYKQISGDVRQATTSPMTITAITFTNRWDQPASAIVRELVTCGSTTTPAFLTEIDVAPRSTEHLSYPSGLVVPPRAGCTQKIDVLANGGANSIFLVGYDG